VMGAISRGGAARSASRVRYGFIAQFGGGWLHFRPSQRAGVARCG
jgi:hypothetical protein